MSDACIINEKKKEKRDVLLFATTIVINTRATTGKGNTQTELVACIVIWAMPLGVGANQPRFSIAFFILFN